ncbi:hypothetical protein MNBD_GAMMA22-2274 [hydrothermal vent metagenome]|uniref:Starvation lipoprotein Slp paralog n=1 Tax=hydrothermal vent metagenome TaxID=652676 RepID=A0A3B0ZUZ8_9ZZZZ
MIKLKSLAIFVISLTFLILTSCAAKPPLILQLDNEQVVTPLSQVDIESSLGQTVRWGGTIIETINKKDYSQIIILAYPLDNEARPINFERDGTRRFIAKFDYFIEPNTYSKDREITIIGKLDRIEQSKVGEFDYEFPIITVEKHLLWPIRSNYDPYYNDNYYYWNPYYYPVHHNLGHHGHHYSH